MSRLILSRDSLHIGATRRLNRSIGSARVASTRQYHTHRSRAISLRFLAITGAFSVAYVIGTSRAHNSSKELGLDDGMICGSNIDSLLGEVDELYRAKKESDHIPGMIYGIISQGKLIHSVASGYACLEKPCRVAVDTRFRIASMSKSFTAMAILQLRDHGKLQLDDPISKYIPDITFVPVSENTRDYPELTVRHLLKHAGGMPQEDPWVSSTSVLSVLC